MTRFVRVRWLIATVASIFLLLFAAVSFSLAANVASTLDNRLTNGDFSDGLDGWTLWCAGWGGVPKSLSECGSFYSTSSDGLYLDHSGTPYNAPYHGVMQTVPATANSVINGTVTIHGGMTNCHGMVDVAVGLNDASGNRIAGIDLYYRNGCMPYSNDNTNYYQYMSSWAPGSGAQTFTIDVAQILAQHLPTVDAGQVASITLTLRNYADFTRPMVTFGNLSLTSSDPPPSTITPTITLTITPTITPTPGTPTSALSLPWFDGGETGGPGWTYQSPWALVPSSGSDPAYSGNNVWSDSPGVNYADNTNAALTSPALNVAPAAGGPVTLAYWLRYRLETYYDYLYVEYRFDGGSWQQLTSYTGYSETYQRYTHVISIPNSAQTLQVRFRLVADYIYNDAGVNLDDVEVTIGAAVTPTVTATPGTPVAALSLPWFDGGETGGPGWTYQSPWALVPSSGSDPAYSGNYAWSDSPGGNYANYTNAALTSPALNVAPAAGGPVTLAYWLRYDLETNWDYLNVEFQIDGGSWQQAAQYTGSNSTYTRYAHAITIPSGAQTLRIRFRLTSDSIINFNGVNLDDVEVTIGASGLPTSTPTPVSVTVSVQVTDGNGTPVTDAGVSLNPVSGSSVYLNHTGNGYYSGSAPPAPTTSGRCTRTTRSRASRRSTSRPPGRTRARSFGCWRTMRRCRGIFATRRPATRSLG